MKIKGINFSTKYAKGSIADRVSTMRQIRGDIYNNVMKEFDKPANVSNPLRRKESVPISNLERLVKEKLPEPLKFILKKVQLQKRQTEGIVMDYLSGSNIKYYRMELLAEKNQLPIFSVPTLMHEVTHLLDFALQPQYRVVKEQLCKKGLLKDVNNHYITNFYTTKKVSKSKIQRNTKKIMKDMSTEDKLLTLKFISKQLSTELRGFDATRTYANKLNGWNNYEMGFNEKVYQQLHLERNLELVNKMRAQLISKERKSFKKAHKSNS